MLRRCLGYLCPLIIHCLYLQLRKLRYESYITLEYAVFVPLRSKVTYFLSLISQHMLILCKAFADCALGRTFSAPFYCRDQRLAMNTCMIAHATQTEQDAAREEWFATRLQRQREREEKEARRIEQERFHREWWGLPVEDREGEKGRKLVKQAERVGGFPKRDEDSLSKDRHR